MLQKSCKHHLWCLWHTYHLMHWNVWHIFDTFDIALIFVWFIKLLFNLTDFRGPPLGDGVNGWGGSLSGCVWGVLCLSKHMSDDVKNGIPQGIPYRSSHLHEIIMFIHVHVCAYICVGMYMCMGMPLHPHTSQCSPHPYPSTPCPPRGDPSNQSKVNKNWHISILFEDF